jgi:hypothetical protein
MTAYGVAFHNYENKETKIIEWFTDKYNALEALQEYAFKFIYDKQGFRHISIFEEGGHGRPFGYFVERSPSKNLNSLKIKYKKYERGYVYGTTEFENICLFSLVKTFKKPKSNDSYWNESWQMEHNVEYKKVMSELLEKDTLEKNIEIIKNEQLEDSTTSDSDLDIIED